MNARRLTRLLFSSIFPLVLSGCLLEPAPGAPQWQDPALIEVPGGTVNVVGGNLLVRRTDLSIDTRLGTQEIGATYNSATRAWRWSFDVAYDGKRFVDASGAVHDVSTVPPGTAIPGTVWVVSGSDAIRTKGGLVHAFSGGRLAALHWASSDYPRLVVRRDPATSDATAIEQCTAQASCTAVFAIARDAAGRVTAITDRAGRSAAFSYDAAGYLATARDALDVSTGAAGFRYEYAANGALVGITNSEGERIEYAFTGPRPSQVRPIGGSQPVYTFTYVDKDKTTGLWRTELIDPLGHRATYWYDGQRRVHRVVDAAGDETLRTWTGLRVTVMVAPDGGTTRWTFAGDDVATMTGPSGNVRTYAYAADAVDRDAPLSRPIERITDGLGLVEERTYDAAGRLVAVTDGAGDTTIYEYDPLEEIAAIIDPADVVTLHEDYGEHGHPTRIVRGSFTDERTYDAVGNLLKGARLLEPLSPAMGGVISRSFDADRNVHEAVLADLRGLEYSTAVLTVDYRSDGRPTRISRPYGGDTEFDYDDLGRLVARRERASGTGHPEWAATRFEYDALGRQTAVELANGMRLELDFDGLGRPVAQRTLQSGTLEGQLALGWSEGHLVTLADSALGGVERRYYDAAGRLDVISHPGGEQEKYLFDLRGQQTGSLFWTPVAGLQATVEYEHDGASRQTRVTVNDEVLLEHAYAGGRLASTRYGNGLERVRGYDEGTGELVTQTTTDAGGAVVESTSLERLWCILPGIFCLRVTTATDGGTLGPKSTTEEYILGAAGFGDGHDLLPPTGSRIFLWNGSSDGAPSGSEGFTYDFLSNVMTKSVADPDTSFRFVYNAEHNRLLRVENNATGAAVVTYDYDAAGHVTQRNGVPLDWTAAGRIGGFGSEVTFVWDGLGRPISRLAGGSETRFGFAGQVEMGEDGRATALDLGDVRVDLTLGERRYRHFDFRHNVKLVSDETGTLRTHYFYAPYGVQDVLGDQVDARTFAQGVQAGEFVLLGSRLYEPLVARFLSPDPVFQHINQYAYVHGNPVWFWDPDGNEAAGGGGAGFAAGALAALGVALIAGGVLSLNVMALHLGFAALSTAYVLYAIGQSTSAGLTSLPQVTIASASYGGGSGGAGACASPTVAATMPDLGWLLLILIPLQVLLAWQILGRRAAARSSTADAEPVRG